MRAHSPPVGSASEEGRGFWETLWHEAKSVAAASYRLIPFSKPFVQVYDFVSSYRAQDGGHSAFRVARAAAEAMDTPLGAIAYSVVQNWRNTAGSNLVYRLYVTIAGPAGEMFLAGRAATVIEGRDAEGNRYTKGGRAAHGLLLVGEFGLTVYGGRGFLTPIGCLRRCRKVLRAPNSGGTACVPASTQSTLTSAAQRAHGTVGAGRGPVHGTRVHSAFAAEVNALGNPNLSTEVSYLNGRVVPRGTPGSVRLDVVEGPLTAPTAVYDLKTGGATLTPARIQQIQQHVPGGASVPVIEIR